MKSSENHLHRLEDLKDYQVAPDDTDIRNWNVIDVDDRVIGTVDSLLVDLVTKRVVYVDVEVDDSIISANHDPDSSPGELKEFKNKAGDTHIIIPIGTIDIDLSRHRVRALGLNHRSFSDAPRYDRNYSFDREYEKSVLRYYLNREEHFLNEEEFYNRPEFHRKN